MALKISNSRCHMYLGTLSIAFVSCIIAYLTKWCLPDLAKSAVISLYLIFGIFIPSIAVISVFFPLIEIYTGKTYTKYSHLILALEIVAIMFVIITSILTNPTIIPVNSNYISS